MDDMDEAEAIIYRIAYGLARDRIEHDIAPRSSSRDVDDLARRLVAQIAAELGDASGRALSAIRLGVEDAAEGRRPRW